MQLFTSADALSKARRGLGWDLHSRYGVGNSSAGTRMGPRTFGHTGFTGCSLWMDPATTKYVILLTNAVHPHEMSETGGEIQSVRPAVADAALLALDEGRLAEAAARMELGGDGDGAEQVALEARLLPVPLLPGAAVE